MKAPPGNYTLLSVSYFLDHHSGARDALGAYCTCGACGACVARDARSARGTLGDHIIFSLHALISIQNLEGLLCMSPLKSMLGPQNKIHGSRTWNETEMKTNSLKKNQNEGPPDEGPP